MTNKVIYSIVLFLIILAAVFFMSGSDIFSTNNISESIIDLNYRAEMEVSPDRARIFIGVISNADKIEEASSENKKKISLINDSLKEYKEVDFNTVSYRVEPVYSYDNNEREKLLYYRVINTLEITLADLDLTGEIIDKALSAGANNINHLEYFLVEKEKVREKVIKKALIGLENKIELVAKQLDKKEYHLKNMQINDNFQGRNIYYNTAQKSTADSGKLPTQINPDDIKITVNVSGEYIVSD